jgi:hypothetical protein
MGPRCNALVKPAIDKPPFLAFLDHLISSVELRLLDAMKITDRYRHVWGCVVCPYVLTPMSKATEAVAERIPMSFKGE